MIGGCFPLLLLLNLNLNIEEGVRPKRERERGRERILQFTRQERREIFFFKIIK